MALLPYSFARKALFALDAETAHDVVIHSLSLSHRTPLAQLYQEQTIEDPVVLAGLHFKNRIGLAAGLDKNARAIDGLAAFGFGSIEVGTVTPLPQAGNPKPRLFRLPEANALINRMGFNNLGVAACIENIKRSGFQKNGGILGINIGKNAFTPIEKAAEDYLTCLRQAYTYADYITINISSPNTQNLRELQKDAALDALLASLGREREILAQASGKRVPLFVKIAPDLDAVQIQTIALSLQSHFMDGVIATNTTLARDAVKQLNHGNETGGLSGAPVFESSNAVIRQLRTALGAAYPIIGVGGVMSGADAVAKLHAGADLVQIYTGLIYQGSELVKACALAMKTARK